MKYPIALGIFIVCYLLLGGLAPTAAQPDEDFQQELAIVNVKHRSAKTIHDLLEPLLTPDSAVNVDTEQNRLILKGSVILLRQLRETITQLDQPGRQRRLSVTLEIYEAHVESQGKAAKLDPALRTMLDSTFTFAEYQLLNKTVLQATENQKAELATLQQQIAFTPSVAVEEQGKTLVTLNQLQITRQLNQYQINFRNTVSTADKQTTIIGGSSLHTPEHAILFILKAEVLQ